MKNEILKGVGNNKNYQKIIVSHIDKVLKHLSLI